MNQIPTHELPIAQKTWQDIGFRIEMTEDNSPTLRLLQSSTERFAEGEAMHHSGGAYSETDLIYGHCAREVFANAAKPAFMVVGLGLGYIEMVIVREALLRSQPIEKITSFESVTELRVFFNRWIDDLPLHPEVQKIYDEAAHFVLRETTLQVSDLKKALQKIFPSLASLQSALDEKTILHGKYHGFMYDAFSSKTTPHLWEENFLVELLNFADTEYSFLATYACKASLKRALKSQQFEVHILEGFTGKRNRVSASRKKQF